MRSASSERDLPFAEIACPVADPLVDVCIVGNNERRVWHDACFEQDGRRVRCATMYKDQKALVLAATGLL